MTCSNFLNGFLGLLLPADTAVGEITPIYGLTRVESHLEVYHY